MKLFFALVLMSLTAAIGNAEEKGRARESLVLGGGCFWCLEGAYEIIPGVVDVVNGYAGGSVPNPTYEQVCSHATGHAEVVRIDYDPGQVSLERILAFFWTIHDPTSLNRQGNDEGPQYRSIILYSNEAQKTAAEASIKKEQAQLSKPIVTELVPLKEFYRAEEYHQDYFRKNPTAGYCRYVVKPKVDKVKKLLGAGGQ